MPSSPRKKPEASSAERIEASGGWWPRPESNQRHTDFQSAALPTELLGRAGASGNRSARKRSADYKGKVLTPPALEPKKSPPQGRAHCALWSAGSYALAFSGSQMLI